MVKASDTRHVYIVGGDGNVLDVSSDGYLTIQCGTTFPVAQQGSITVLPGTTFPVAEQGIVTVVPGDTFNIHLQDPNDDTRFAEFDNKFKIPVVISVEHHEVHRGEMYIADEVVSAALLDLAFKIPSGTKRVHFIFQWAAQSKAHIEIYEGRTWTASTGSTIPIFNRDRNSLNTSQMQEDTTGAFGANMAVIQDPTGQAGGTIIHNEYTWSDKKQTTRSRDVSEFILKNDETYVIKLTSDDGAKGLHLALHWYEHTEG